jgi:hypothetical protein
LHIVINNGQTMLNRRYGGRVEFYVTAAIFALAIAFAGTMAWLERRPRPAMSPRLIPTTPLMLAAVLLAVLAGSHLLSLWGIQHGRFPRP